ncbi:hypothetical protein MRX96_059293 [Rhipicephalus microplus]
MGIRKLVMLVLILLSIGGSMTVQAGYQGDSRFLLPRVHGTIVPQTLPAKPTGFQTVSPGADRLPPPNFAAGTFHGIPPVLERYPLPSYPLGPPLTKTQVLGGRPALRIFTQRIPAIPKVITPVVVPRPSSEPLYPPHPYEFGYDTVDEFGNTQYRHETSDVHNNKHGFYGYTDANGIYRQVDYVADSNGFRAHIRTNEPGTTSSAPAGALYDSKPVSAVATFIKSQRGGLVFQAGRHQGRPNAGKEFPITPHLQGPPAASVENDSHSIVDRDPTVADENGSGGRDGVEEVVATKVLTDPADPRGVHATLGIVALRPRHRVRVTGYEYKTKSR